MNNCTEITVLNLSDEASARIGGATTATLDVDTQTLRFSKDVEGLTDAGKIKTEGVLGLTLPRSKVNDAVFLPYSSPFTLDNTTEFFDVRIFVEGHHVQFNRLYVLGLEVDGWSVELRRSPDHWVELTQQITLRDLDFGTFEVSAANLDDNWQLPEYTGNGTDPGTISPQYWPLVDYGGWVDLSEPAQDTETLQDVKSVALGDFRPLVSFPYMLRAAFIKQGWTLDGVILDSPWCRRLWVYALTQTYYDAGEFIGVIGFLSLQTSSQVLAFDGLEYAYTPMQVDFSGQYLAGIRNTENVKLRYRFKARFRLRNTGGSASEQTFWVGEADPLDPLVSTGEILSEETVIEVPAGQTKDVVLDFHVPLDPGQIGAIFPATLLGSTCTILEGLRFEAYPDDRCFVGGQVVNVAQALTDEYNMLEWFKSFMHLIRGRIDTDFLTKTVTIHPDRRTDLFGDVIPGFVLDEDPAVDISHMLVAGSEKTTVVRPTLNRYTKIGFKESTDAYIQSLNLTEPPHGRVLNNGEDLPNETTEILNPIFEPTFEGQPTGLASGNANREPVPHLPRMWDNTAGDRSFNIKPRVLYAFGLVRQKNPSPVGNADTWASFYLNAGPIPTTDPQTQFFGYATSLRTWELNPTPSADANVVFGTLAADLFTNFYLGYTSERNGTRLEVLLNMRMRDYLRFNFREMLSFPFRGRTAIVTMESIKDHAPCEGTTTPVTFFIPAQYTERCDLPCGCVFSTCEYYQDFGVFLRQATLDDMAVSSFMVDGIELISTPLGFGKITFAEIDGKPFVTNLIDTLNSVGAPYFRFDMSTRTHPEKGKRYFKIKRPKCVPFQIIITSGGSEVYKYTQAEQKQKWFSGTWSDFGYGSAFHGTPENCIETTEY